MNHVLSTLLATILVAASTSARADRASECAVIVGTVKSVQQRLDVSREDLEFISREYRDNRSKGYNEDILGFGRSSASKTRDRLIGEGRQFDDALNDARTKRCLDETELGAYRARGERMVSEGLLHYRSMM